MAHYRCPAGCRGHYAEPGTCQEASRRARILSNVPVRIPSTMIALTVRNFEHITNRDDHAYDDSRAIEISGADLLSIAKAPFLAISIS